MKGEVVYLYAFDVANEIVTAKIQEILAKKPFAFEIRTDHTFPKDVPLYKPLAIEPPPLPARLCGQPVSLLIRVYEVGVVSITMRVSFEVAQLLELMPFHQPTLDNGRPLDQVAHDLCTDVCQGLRDVMLHGAPPTQPEAYTVFCLNEIEGVQDVNQWLAAERRTVAGLLTETAPERLSETQVQEVLRIQRSFENTDVTIIDWDAALAIDLQGYTDDVLYVLELANLQLEEFRWMDEKLDRYLDRAYEDLKPSRFGLFGTSSAMLLSLRLFRMDVTRLNDEVTHIGKFFGDWYLARVYLGARERFYLDQWRNSVENRLAQLDKLYTVVNTEVTNQRLLWLEVAIVVLFVLDLVGVLFWKT